jgi:hypothetical protein
MPTLTDRHFALKVLFPKITCRDDCREFELFGGLGEGEELLNLAYKWVAREKKCRLHLYY